MTSRKDAKMKDFRGLIVWPKGIDPVDKIYQIARLFPKEEMYGLSSQIKRRAVSIPSNIAEGFGRNQHLILYTFCILQEVHFMNFKHYWRFRKEQNIFQISN